MPELSDAWKTRCREWTEVLDADGNVIAMFRDEYLAGEYAEWMNG
jgi:hypothetical protein